MRSESGFVQTKSISRKLSLTILVIATFFLMESFGIYLFSRQFLGELAELQRLTQMNEAARKTKEIMPFMMENLTGLANESAKMQRQQIFQGAYREAMGMLKVCLDLAVPGGRAAPFLHQAREALVQLNETAQALAIGRGEIQAHLLFAEQFRLEALEGLTKSQVFFTSEANTVFNRVYGMRFQPIVASLVMAVIFLSFALWMGLGISMQLKHSIHNILTATRAVTAGDLSYQAKILAPDEIGSLTNAFNLMTKGLQQSTVSNEYVENIIQSMTDCLLVVDGNGRIVKMNEVTILTLGYGLQELLGQPIGQIFPLDFAWPETARDLETHCLTKAGERIPVSLAVSVLHAREEGIREQVCVIKDITLQKQAAQELEQKNAALTSANRELEAFSYSVSHDLRAPLRAVDGFSIALLEDCADKFDENGKRYLDRIRKAIQRMGRLIDDILDLSRIARAGMTVQPVNLSSMVQQVAEELKEGQPNARKIDLKVAENVVVSADPILMKVVFENLIGNSFKYTSKHPEAHIEFGVIQDSRERVFFVRDDGAGFDMSHAENLFGAFQRLHRESEFPGTGVGLATVQRVITRHRGRLWAESRIEKGATFYFTLGTDQELV